MTIAYVPGGPAGVAAVTLGHSRRHLPAHHAARDPGRRTATAPATVPSTKEPRQQVENYAYLSLRPAAGRRSAPHDRRAGRRMFIQITARTQAAALPEPYVHETRSRDADARHCERRHGFGRPIPIEGVRQCCVGASRLLTSLEAVASADVRR